MSYNAGEALILTQVRASGTFGTTTSSRGNYTILNSGAGKSYCIIRPGPFEHYAQGLGGRYGWRWTTVAEIWVLIDDYGTTLTTLESRRQEVMDRLDQYRKAQDATGTVQDVMVRAGSEVFEMFPPAGRPAFLRQDLFIEWVEESTTTLQE